MLQQLLKGGNYSREETISGSTVNEFGRSSKSTCFDSNTLVSQIGVGTLFSVGKGIFRMFMKGKNAYLMCQNNKRRAYIYPVHKGT